MIKVVIFDLDNTLLDFIRMKQNAVQSAVAAMVEAGLPMDREQAYRDIIRLYETRGWENQSIFDDYLRETTGEIHYKFLAAAIVAYRRARESSLALYPNVRETLLELAQMGVKVAVVSDAPAREAWLRITYLNLQRHFDLVLTFNDIGERKPSPKGFQMVMDHFGALPPEVLMVGDWPERDMVGAGQLGIRTVFARYGDTFDTVESGANWVVDDIFEVARIVRSINGG